MGELGRFATGITFAAGTTELRLRVQICRLIFFKQAVRLLPSTFCRPPFFTLQELSEGDGHGEISATRWPKKKQGMRDALTLGKLQQKRFGSVLADDVAEDHVLCRKSPLIGDHANAAHKTVADSTALFDFMRSEQIRIPYYQKQIVRPLFGEKNACLYREPGKTALLEGFCVGAKVQ